MQMMHTLLVIATTALVLPPGTSAAAQSCQNIVLPMKGGSIYTGVVRNEEYRFSAIVPTGKVGWGVSSPAPFHGFIMFLDGSSRYREGDSCIDFSVRVLVSPPEERPEKAAARNKAKAVTLGNRRGWEEVDREMIGARSFTVVTVLVELPRPLGQAEVVSVVLISPTDRYVTNRRTFDRFLSDLTFW